MTDYDPTFARDNDDNTSDALHDLAGSTKALYGRFSFVPTMPDAVRIFAEEANELIREGQKAEVSTDQLAHEAADVFVTALGMCFASGVELDKVIEQIYAVIAKNDSKTDQTHILLDGKIRRKEAANGG